MPDPVLDTPAPPEDAETLAPDGDPSLHNPDPLYPNDPSEDLAGDPPADPPKANWYDSLDPDIKNHPKIKRYKNAEELAKGYLELNSLMGKEKVALPKDENDKVAIAHLNKALGVPETPEGYELAEPEPLPGLEHMQFGMDDFKAFAHKNNLTPKQAEGVKQDYMQMLAGIKENAEKAHIAAVEKSKAELNREWGLAFESKVKLAQNVMNKFAGGKENFDHINAMIGADPVALKWLATIGENFSEGSLGNLGDSVTGFTKTPAEAKAEYEGIMNDSNDIYWSGVRNKNTVPESLRKERISYVESLLQMSQAGRHS